MEIRHNAYGVAPGVVLKDIKPGCRVCIIFYIDRIIVLF